MGYRVSVVGATGNVGREILSILSENNFPADDVTAIASTSSRGKEVSYGDKVLHCVSLDQYDFSKSDICFMSAGSGVSSEWAPKIVSGGGVVIDNSSCWRYDDSVPLIVPEVNPDDLNAYMSRNSWKGIIANPNCSTIQLVVALKPLHDAYGIKRIVVSTYQSVSGAGHAAMDELWDQTRSIFTTDTIPAEHFPKQIAFNVIPHIDVFMEDGSTKEEWKVRTETNKILCSSILVSCTAVRVPVFVGHSEAVNIEFLHPVTVDGVRDLLRESAGCLVIDAHKPGGYATPIDCVGEYSTFISRIRLDETVDYGLSMWVVSDNLRKGAALNAVQIGETLISRNLL